MELAFLDTSVVFKLYFDEPGSGAMLALVEAEHTQIALSSMAVLEFQAGVRMRARLRACEPARAEEVLAHFRRMTGQEWLRQPLSEAVVDLARLLLDRHPLRAPDALHLASCMALQATGSGVRFVCSDHVLLRAAAAEGLACWDPAGGVE